FARQVRGGHVDALVCFDRNGNPAYPSAATAPKQDETKNRGWRDAQALESRDALAAAASYAQLSRAETNADLVARALQAQARCLAQAGQKPEAISVLTSLVRQESLQRATDAQGRLLAPNAALMLIELTGAPAHSPDSISRQ